MLYVGEVHLPLCGEPAVNGSQARYLRARQAHREVSLTREVRQAVRSGLLVARAAVRLVAGAVHAGVLVKVAYPAAAALA